jgi:hypothetical protein
MKTKLTTLIALFLVAAFLLTGCQAKPAALSNEEVVQLTGQILTALNDGDYAAFTQDFSDEMLAAFPEDQFTALGTLLQETSGNYVSCGEPSISNNGGYASYRLTCPFDLEDVVVTIVFKVDGDRVEGLFFDSPNLRALSQ